MQQYAAEAIAYDDRHLARRRGHCIERGKRLARGRFSDALGAIIEQFESDVAAASLSAVLDAPIAGGNHLRGQSYADAVVARRQSFGVVNRDRAAVLAVAGRDLADFVADAARGLIEQSQHRDLVGDLDVLRTAINDLSVDLP